MPKPMRKGGCCACAGAINASDRATSPIESHGVSLFIPNLLLRWGMLTRRFPRCQSIRASGRRGSLASEPVEDLLAGPMHDARFAQHVPIQSLKIADAVRDA